MSSTSSTYSPETPFDNTCRWSPSPARSPQPRRSSTPRATRETSRSTRRPSRSSRRTSSSNRRADIDLVSGATMTGQEGGLVARHGHRGGSSAWRPRLPCRAWRRACNQGSCLAWSDLSSPAGSDTTVKRAARAGPPASGRVSSDAIGVAQAAIAVCVSRCNLSVGSPGISAGSQSHVSEQGR